MGIGKWELDLRLATKDMVHGPWFQGWVERGKLSGSNQEVERETVFRKRLDSWCRVPGTRIHAKTEVEKREYGHQGLES